MGRKYSVEEWNALFHVGTPVRFWPVRGRAAYEDTQTESEAWALGDGSVVVLVDGRSGGVAVEHCEPLDHDGKTYCNEYYHGYNCECFNGT